MDKELEMQNAEEVLEPVEEVTEAPAEEAEEAAEAEEKIEEEVEELTEDFEEEPAEETEKKSGKGWIFGLLAAVIALAIIFFVAVPMFKGEGEAPAVNGDEIVLKIGEQEFDLNEYNFMYISSFNEIYSDLYSYYGDSVSYIVDITKPLEEQMVSDTQTWHDYLSDYTVDTLKNLTGLYNAAMADGFVLPEEYQADLDNIETQITETAATSDMTMEEYIELMYGEGVTLETIKAMTEFRYIAGIYAEEYEKTITVSDEDIAAYYSANKNTIDTVDFRYYSFAYGEGALTEEEAKARAEAITATKNAEEFNALAYEYSTDEQKAYFTEGSDPTLFAGCGYNSTGIEEVSNWLFEEGRVQGDTMVYFDETYQSYLAVMFETRNNPDYNLIDIRHILIMPEKAEDSSISDEAWAAAEAKATEVLTEYLAGEMTEDAFSALAAEYSADGNAAQGGIYEDVYKGQMVAPFEEWCFADGRKTGDTGIVKTQYGYHVMYFVGEGDNNLVSLIQPTILQEQVNAWVLELASTVEAEKLPAFESAGGIIDDIINAANEKAAAEAEAESSESAEGTESEASEETSSAEC